MKEEIIRLGLKGWWEKPKLKPFQIEGEKTNPKQEKGINRTCSESRVGLSGLQPVLV